MLVARALVVDDEPLCLQVVSRLLSNEGVKVFPATSPLQALEIIRSNPTFALVLSDVVMPEMHGTELVREVARISPETALILMSGGPVEPASRMRSAPG